jgi:hypothetical protein
MNGIEIRSAIAITPNTINPIWVSTNEPDEATALGVAVHVELSITFYTEYLGLTGSNSALLVELRIPEGLRTRGLSFVTYSL